MNWSWLKAFSFNNKGLKKEYKEKPIFPCSDDSCLIRMCDCSQACDKLEIDDNKLMKLFLEYNACPDCGCETFSEGAHGGMAVNVKCDGCGHWFNFGLPLFIQRIHIDKNTGRFYD